MALGLLISITGGPDLTLYEVDEAATRIREEVDPDANIILGATFDEALEGTMRVSVVATGLNKAEEEARAAAAGEPIEPPKRPLVARNLVYATALPHQPTVKRPVDPRPAMAVAQGAGSFLRLRRLRSRIPATMNSRRRMSMRRPPPRFMGRARLPAVEPAALPLRSPACRHSRSFRRSSGTSLPCARARSSELLDEGQTRRRGCSTAWPRPLAEGTTHRLILSASRSFGAGR